MKAQAQEITDSGAKLYTLLGQEEDLKKARENALSFLENLSKQGDGENNWIKNSVENLVESQRSQILNTEKMVENLKGDEARLGDKLTKKTGRIINNRKTSQIFTISQTSIYGWIRTFTSRTWILIKRLSHQIPQPKLPRVRVGEIYQGRGKPGQRVTPCDAEDAGPDQRWGNQTDDGCGWLRWQWFWPQNQPELQRGLQQKPWRCKRQCRCQHGRRRQRTTGVRWWWR